MIDYDNLMAAVHAEDEPAIVKILEKESAAEIQEIRRDCEVLLGITGVVLREKKNVEPPVPCKREHCEVCGT